MASRVRIEPIDDGVRVSAPSPRSRWAGYGLLVLIPVFAVALLASAVFATALLAVVRTMPPLVAVIVFVLVLVFPVAAAFGTIVAAVRLLYGLVGRECIEATPYMLADARSVGVFSRKRHWPAMRVEDLRLSPMAGGAFDPRLIAFRGVLFEVDGTRTRSIAEGCTPAEAAEVLAAVQTAMSASLIRREAADGE
jgi:hypothetical protein